MATIKFTDGVMFNTDGELRCEHRKDGWYVVGRGTLSPVSSYEEGAEMIRMMEAKDERKET